MENTSRAGTYVQPSSAHLKEVDGFKLQFETASAYEAMKEKARKDGINIPIVSAYRAGKGSGGNTFYNKPYYQDTTKIIPQARSVADAGKSQHNTGLSIDIVNASSSQASNQIKSSWYKWMVDNAHTFGFINSFPPKVINGVLTAEVVSRDTINPNVYIIAEPWHWLFVGSETARNILKLTKC